MQANLLPRIGLCLALSVGAQAFAQTPPRHDIEFELVNLDGMVEIADRIELDGRDSFRFSLAPWLEIESLRLDGETVEAVRQGQQRLVALAGRPQQRLELILRGRLPARNGDGGMRSSYADDGLYLPGYDDWIPYTGEPIVYRLRVSVPAPLLAVASGRLQDETQTGERYRASYEVTRPSEPPSLFAGPYQVGERIVDGLRLRTYLHAELVGLSEVYLGAAAGYIERYSEIIGDYPYDDFHVISAPLPVGLGFPNLTYVGRRVLPLPFMRGRSLAHEVLHNWWGNGVTVDYAGGNWAEGLTTYMADYALELDKGEDAARSMRIKWLRDFAALPAERDRPVREFTSKSHQAAQVIGYNKVAFIFHMLREEIGAAAFTDGLRRFWQRHRHGVAGWSELQTAFERAAGRELDWFFTQWLERRGAPRLSLGAHRVSRVEDGYAVSVEVLQPVAGYRLRLPVLLVTEDGRERHEITIEDALTRVEWKTSARPGYIHFDPDSDLFRRLQPDEAPPILRDVTLDPSTVTVIAAGDDGFVDAARRLAARLMDVAPRFASRLPDVAAQPLLLVSSSANLQGRLERLQLRRPAGLPEGGYSAAAWTARLGNGVPVLVISADDTTALETLLRPLPHYGGQSYVMFSGGRAAERGIWPVTRGPLYLDLDGDN